jgi:hypothetical protein
VGVAATCGKFLLPTRIAVFTVVNAFGATVLSSFTGRT